jgi:hypothetical protein
MARNAPVPRPRHRTGAARVEAAATVVPAAPAAGSEAEASAMEPPPEVATPDDARTVYSWLCRFTDDPAECERLLVDVLRRSRAGGPSFLRSASAATRLQFLTIQGVLHLRGVL